MLQVANLSKSFAGRKLFEDVTFSLSKGEIAGLVGRNGSGKSTLIKIILGQESPDSGDITTPKGYKIGYLDQHIHFTKPTLIEECCQVLPEEEKFDFYKAEKILFGLGFEESDMQRSPDEFSGGYQLRINLTKSLLQQPDLLLLDEPTNYLDILSLRWLRQFLKQFRGEVIIITHDRDFMDSVTTHTMGLTRKSLRKVKGSTAKFYEQLELDDEIYEKTRSNQEKKIKDMHKFVERFRAKASKATQAQSKLKAIEKIEVLDKLDNEAELGFRFHYQPIPAKVLMSVNQLGFSYSGKSEEQLFSKLKFSVKPGDRVAVVGKNGKGKTTLLNVLAGQLKPNQGEIDFHPSVSLGYYQQTNRKNLNPKNSVYEEIAASNIELSISQARGICGAMMFPGEDADKKIKVLSGGEQARVLLGKVLAHPANLLFLDEPSNHLDMQSISTMTEQIDKFKGGVVLVTHNEEMLRCLANKLIVFRNGGAELFLGTYDEFLEKIGWGDAPIKKEKKKAKDSRVDNKKQQRKLRSLKNKMTTCEEKIEKLEAIIHDKSNQAAELALSGHEDAQTLYAEISEHQKQIEIEFAELEDLENQIQQLDQ